MTKAWLDRVRHPLPWIALGGLAVRLYGLTYHSLWFDEVMSTFWAARPVGQIWRVGLALAQDKHPPLYYLLLHGWVTLWAVIQGGSGSASIIVGNSDYLVRSLGSLLGVLAVFPAYGIGRLVGGRKAVALGAALIAVNPFLIWYSQEARMFMPATTFALAGLFGVLLLSCETAARIPRRRLAASLLIIGGFTAALYTYLFSALLLPVAGLWLLVVFLARRGSPGAAQRFWWGAGCLAIVVLLFAPLARSAWAVSGDEASPGRIFEGLGPALWRLLPIYAIGWPHWSPPATQVVAVTALLLAVAGLLCSVRVGARLSNRAESPEVLPVLLAIWLALPVLAGGMLLARDRTVFAETRYFIFLVPALCLTWGCALSRLWRWRAWLGLAAVGLFCAVTLAALPSLWSPANRREDWRSAAAFVMAHAGPHDAVLLQADYVHSAFDRYFSGPQAEFYPFTERLADPGPVDVTLSGLADAGYDAVWLVQSHHQELDPQNLVAGWFASRYPSITEVYPQGIVIHGFAIRYRTASLPALPAGYQAGPASGQVGTTPLQLVRCAYLPLSLAARDDLLHPPSGWVHAIVHWTVRSATASDHSPSLRLVDDGGQIWGDSLDRPGAAFRLWPTSRWKPGEFVRADYDVNLNPITPPGTYHLVLSEPSGSGDLKCGDVVVR